MNMPNKIDSMKYICAIQLAKTPAAAALEAETGAVDEVTAAVAVVIAEFVATL